MQEKKLNFLAHFVYIKPMKSFPEFNTSTFVISLSAFDKF